MAYMPIMDLRQEKTLRNNRRYLKSIAHHRATFLVQVELTAARLLAQARERSKSLINVTSRHPQARRTWPWIKSYNLLRPRARRIRSARGGLLVHGSLCRLLRIATLFGIMIPKTYLWKKCSAKNFKICRL